jgi:hypothetical protein
MKKLRILSLVLSLLFLFGCNLIDQIKGLEEIDFDIELVTSVPVDVDEDDPLTINETFTLDATTNKDVADNLNKITEYDVWAVYVTFSNYDGADDIVFSGTLDIGPFTADFTGDNAVTPSIYADNSGALYLDLNTAALELLNAALQAGHKLNCSVEGTVSGQPVSFTINIYLSGTVYAEI